MACILVSCDEGGCFLRCSCPESLQLSGSIFSVLCRPGSDLLFRVLRRSTIGAGAIYGRVRDGIGYGHPARATRPAKNRGMSTWFCLARLGHCPSALEFVFPGSGVHWLDIDNESDQADRTISTSKLRALLRFHTWPINVVVFHGSQGRTCFEVGFPLRCLQRLSRPHIATLHCRWRDNRSTGGVFIPVLSY